MFSTSRGIRASGRSLTGADLGPCRRESGFGEGRILQLVWGPPLGRYRLRKPGLQWGPEQAGPVLSCGFCSLNTCMGEGVASGGGLTAGRALGPQVQVHPQGKPASLPKGIGITDPTFL